MDTVPGTLYVVATPIGHLEDITLRALASLKQVDLIAAEDTRNSRVLLDRHGIDTPLTALHEHNERSKAPALIEKMQNGDSIAFISDAGTPGISDPGNLLVDLAHQASIRVVPIPGPSAVTTLISVAGFGSSRFYFHGFLPARTNQRNSELESLISLPMTLVFYEAPHRIRSTLKSMAEVLGGTRPLVIGRELTKRFEQVHRCQLAEALLWLDGDENRERGEFVVAVAGAEEARGTDLQESERLLTVLLNHLPLSQAVQIAAEMGAGNRSELYQQALALRDSGNYTI